LVILFSRETTAQTVVGLPSQRDVIAGEQQSVNLAHEIFHHTQGGDIYSSATLTDDDYVLDFAYEMFKGNSMTVRTDMVAEASCSIPESASSYAPEVNVAGLIEGRVQKGSAAAAGYVWQLIHTATAFGTFTILRHPTIDTRGSELNEQVTVFENLGFFFYGGNTGNGTVGRAGRITSGSSDVTAAAWLASGWTLTGTKGDATKDNPNANPIVINENHGGGLDVLLVGSSARNIGGTIGLSSTIALSSSMSRMSGAPTGTDGVNWEYSFAGWFEVKDEQFVP
jgi:hypothetical protein